MQIFFFSVAWTGTIYFTGQAKKFASNWNKTTDWNSKSLLCFFNARNPFYYSNWLFHFFFTF